MELGKIATRKYASVMLTGALATLTLHGHRMNSYKKILLCYDGTLEGRKALRQGAELAVQLNTETHLLSVLDIHSIIAQSTGLFYDITCDRFEQNARAILWDGITQLTEWGLPAHGHLAIGNPVDEIAEHANRLEVGLVVVGHRCRTKLSRWWVGAGNVPLLDRVSCSVLVACSLPVSRGR